MKKTIILLTVVLIPILIYTQDIAVNQVGYIASQIKFAIVTASASGSFNVVDDNTGEVKFTAELGPSRYWNYSGQNVKVADFSNFNQLGTYHIETDNGNFRSYKFKISNNPYKELAKDALHFYYLSRVSMPLEEKYAGKYARAAGHPDTTVIIHKTAAGPNRPAGSTISSPGGWYDAGDYNKYVVNSGISTYTLLAIAEHFEYYALNFKLNIPENENGMADIVDEAIYNLRWMLSMQDPADGGVYHKCTHLNFSDTITPAEAAKTPRYVTMKTTAAALNLAAVTSQASRIIETYVPQDYPELADSCLNAAKLAYEWAIKNPDILYVQPKDITTGQYPDTSVADEFQWAAIELYITTGDIEYLKKSNYLEGGVSVPKWDVVYPLGLISLVRNIQSSSSDVDIEKVEQKIIDYADKLFSIYDTSAYKVAATEFVWGSNSDVANDGLMALQAYHITNEKKYLNAAISALDYLLGRNPTNYCFVTGYGSKSPMHPHDRKSVSDNVKEPIPGMLVGGPNPYNANDCGKDKYPSLLPALAYLDDFCSYSTNEITINWNAPLAYLCCAFSEIMLSGE
ncbi:MAG: glycoside hydrolase family 9 protein [Bacteroidales bacterium]|nr:glycoside hydrolase family 9 protein [Bacteroidales bacterium]